MAVFVPVWEHRGWDGTARIGQFSERLRPHFTDSVNREYTLIQQRSLSSGCCCFKVDTLPYYQVYLLKGQVTHCSTVIERLWKAPFHIFRNLFIAQPSPHTHTVSHHYHLPVICLHIATGGAADSHKRLKGAVWQFEWEKRTFYFFKTHFFKVDWRKDNFTDSCRDPGSLSFLYKS